MNPKNVSALRPAWGRESSPRLLWVYAFLVCAAVALCFSNAIVNDFTNWDDNKYVTDSELIRTVSFDGVKKIFSSFLVGHYHPLTVVSLAIDFAFYGLSPAGYHATSVGIHVLNTLLVFVFFVSLTRNALSASITALLFGIHPLHVESVAWVSERKDVLSVFFYMACLCVYLSSIRSERHRSLRYGMLILLFLAALLSKAQAVTLPVVLLAIDFFEGRRLNPSRICEKVSFFMLSLIFGIIAVLAQRDAGAILDTFPFSLPMRLLYACSNLCLYIGKLIVPINLSVVYPYPSLASWSSFLMVLAESLCVVGFVTCGCLGFLSSLAPRQKDAAQAEPTSSMIDRIAFACQRFLDSLSTGRLIRWAVGNRSVVFGTVFFLVNIVLHLQILPVGPSRISERYTYLSSVGLFFLVGQAVSWMWMSPQPARSWSRYGFAAALSMYCAFLGYTTIERNTVWRNSESLWTNVLEQFPQAVTAYLNRGSYYQVKGEAERALADFNAGLALNPNHVPLLSNRCDVFKKLGRLQEAIEDCGKAISLAPTVEIVYTNRGIAYAKLGKSREAFLDFEKAIHLQPTKASSYVNRANLYDILGMFDSAITDYSHAISLNPRYLAAYHLRGQTRLRTGDLRGAIADFDVAVQSAELRARTLLPRSQAHLMLDNYQQALGDALEAQKLGVKVEASHLQTLEELARR